MSNKDYQLDIPYPLKHTFGYATGFIFLLGIMIYLYLLIIDYLENPIQHTTEETIWMYIFLSILVIGFILSYYSIMCSISSVTNSESYKQKFATNSFGGLKRIPVKPSIGQYKTVHSSKFTV